MLDGQAQVWPCTFPLQQEMQMASMIAKMKICRKEVLVKLPDAVGKRLEQVIRLSGPKQMDALPC